MYSFLVSTSQIGTKEVIKRAKKLIERCRQYYETNRKKVREQSQVYGENHREEKRDRDKKYRENNQDILNAQEIEKRVFVRLLLKCCKMI